MISKLKSLFKKKGSPTPLLYSEPGYCHTCEKSTRFEARHEWYRDHLLCNQCGSIPRERALMLVVKERYPDWRNKRIHESSPYFRGASKLFLEECRDYIPSGYWPGLASGEQHEGTICQDLEALSFTDQSIDIHITQDVFEHLFHPEKALLEIERTLKPGGAHIFTVPLVNKENPSQVRAIIGSDGQVQHLLSPEYHANPTTGTGSLVTRDWGFDIKDFIENCTELQVEIIDKQDDSLGIRGEYSEVIIASKN